jgi:hypothetical protein
MTQVTTQVKAHVLVMKNGSFKYLTQSQYDFARQKKAAGEDGFWIQGAFTDFKMIGEWLPIAKFYEQYPQHRPDSRPVYQPVDFRRTMKHSDAIKGLIQGLERYLHSTPENPIVDGHGMKIWYQGTQAPLDLLAKMYEVLEAIEKGEEPEVNLGNMVKGYMGYTPKA